MAVSINFSFKKNEIDQDEELIIQNLLMNKVQEKFVGNMIINEMKKQYEDDYQAKMKIFMKDFCNPGNVSLNWENSMTLDFSNENDEYPDEMMLYQFTGIDVFDEYGFDSEDVSYGHNIQIDGYSSWPIDDEYYERVLEKILFSAKLAGLEIDTYDVYYATELRVGGYQLTEIESHIKYQLNEIEYHIYNNVDIEAEDYDDIDEFYVELERLIDEYIQTLPELYIKIWERRYDGPNGI